MKKARGLDSFEKAIAAIPAPPPPPMWGWRDLLCACNFASLKFTTEPLDWADRVARSYDPELAETAMRVVAYYPDETPVNAARRYLRANPGWSQPAHRR